LSSFAAGGGSAVAFDLAFLVVIPEGDLLLYLPLLVRSAIHNAVAVACSLYLAKPKKQRIVISTEAAHPFESSAAEKSASLPRALPEAPHSIVFTIAPIYFLPFQPKKRMSSPQTT
jgi:hypothetical protein